MSFKQTDIGLIPEDWDLLRAKDLFDRVTDGTHDTPTKLNDGYPLVTSKSLKNGSIALNNIDYFISEEDYYEVNRRSKVDKNDILFSMIGTIGEVALVRNDPFFAIKNIGLFKSNSFDLSEYCFYWFQSPLANVYINNSKSGSTQKYIPLFKLRDFPIALPVDSERKKIAHVLSKIQQAIETQEQIIKTTQELKKALMQKLFTEGLNGEPQKQTEIGLIPESWEVKRIDEVYVFTRKPRNRNFSKYRDVPFIPMELIPDTGMEANTFIPKDFKDIPSGTYFENGDLLLAKITPSFENGKQGIADINFIFGYATTEVIPIKEIENLSYIQYLHYYLKKEDVRKTLAGKMEGSTGRQRLPKGIVQATLIPFPELSIQKEISSILNELDYKIEITQAKINNLKELFKNSLNQLMTGQIRVKDIDFDIDENKVC